MQICLDRTEYSVYEKDIHLSEKKFPDRFFSFFILFPHKQGVSV